MFIISSKITPFSQSQALDRFIVSSYSTPAPNTLIIDKITAIARYNNIEPIIVFNKADMGDFSDYKKTKDIMLNDYENKNSWAKKMLVNIANAGYFSSDRTVMEYNKDIWKL